MLSALGVPDEEIIADYALTDGFMADRLGAMRASGQLGEGSGSYPPHVLRAEPATMAQTLHLIESEHGSIEGFLLASGVSHSQPQSMREHLLE